MIFDGLESLAAHKLLCEEPEPEPEKKAYTCQYCNHKSISKGDYDRHVMTHTGEKPSPSPALRAHAEGGAEVWALQDAFCWPGVTRRPQTSVRGA